jgi:hypothetical protein
MDTIGLDLRQRESQLCIGRDDGTVEERRIVTSRERFGAVLGNRAPARVLVEASTESEWSRAISKRSTELSVGGISRMTAQPCDLGVTLGK